MTTVLPVREYRPILFSGLMVRAILEGRKKQTRRAIKPGVFLEPENSDEPIVYQSDPTFGSQMLEWGRRPYGSPGDRLWVRENGWQPPPREEISERDLRLGADTWPKYVYDADGISQGDAEDYRAWGWKRRPSIHMPRWASRITLEITNMRVERLQEISETDAQAEGVEYDPLTARNAFAILWHELNDERGLGWDKNPWVWVVEFTRVHPHNQQAAAVA